jgi:two-component sensor histidine kinase/PAS domain-containing protein
VLWLIVSSIILSIATGLAFTLYADPFGIMNAIGHFFQIASFYLIYLAFIETSLRKPQDILYQKLKKNEEKLTEYVGQLNDANAVLEQEIAERKRVEDVLRESEVRFRELFNHMTSGAAVYEAVDNGGDFVFRDLNPAAEKIEKVNRKDILGKRVSEAFPGVKAFGVFEVFQRVWQTGNLEYHPENIYIDERNPGSWRESWVFKLPTGEIVTVYNDITERKLAEEKIQASLLEKETMLKEIHHRVKNNLQVISSLLNMQSSYLQDEKVREMFQNSMNRVSTMAKIHTLLYQSEDLTRIDFGGFIRDLAGRLQQSYGIAESRVEIQVNASDVSLTIETSVPCGLILNELLSNTFKHAFPKGRGGEVNISMKEERDQFTLTVQDNGIGFPAAVDFQNTKSLGLELVNLLVGQMNGTITLTVEGGTIFTITFPAASKGG